MNSHRGNRNSEEWTVEAARDLADELHQKLEKTIREVYAGHKHDPQAAQDLFLWDVPRTQWMREVVLEEQIREVVHRATGPLIGGGEGDPTRVERLRAYQLLFEHAIEGLLPLIGKSSLSAFLSDLDDHLHHDEFEGHIAGLVMNRHIDYAAIRRREHMAELGTELENAARPEG